MTPAALDSSPTCTRCGVFVTVPKMVGGRPWCEVCAARPEVDYVEGFRARRWGKRDGWTWLVAVGLPLNLLQLLGSLSAVVIAATSSAAFYDPTSRGDPILAQAWLLPGQVASLVFGTAFVFGARWSRLGMLVAFALSGVGTWWVSRNNATVMGTGILALLLGSGVWLAVIHSTPNKLFFKLEVSRRELEKAWEIYENNPAARAGFGLGVLSLVAWPLAVVALPLSIVGLKRVNPNAIPPMGRRKQAVAGIVCSCIALLLLVGVLALSGA